MTPRALFWLQKFITNILYMCEAFHFQYMSLCCSLHPIMELLGIPSYYKKTMLLDFASCLMSRPLLKASEVEVMIFMH